MDLPSGNPQLVNSKKNRGIRYDINIDTELAQYLLSENKLDAIWVYDVLCGSYIQRFTLYAKDGAYDVDSVMVPREYGRKGRLNYKYYSAKLKLGPSKK